MQGKTLKLLLLCGIISHFCLAGAGQFYTYTGKFHSKHFGLCPSGNVVQAIVQVNNLAVPPSPTYPFLGQGEMLSTSPQRCEVMGTDLIADYFFGDGNLGSLNSGGSMYNYGYVRAFSGKSIEQSAYFANSPCEVLYNNAGPPSENDIADTVVNLINPAYIIPFDRFPTNNIQTSCK